jgi:hypothetical protein
MLSAYCSINAQNSIIKNEDANFKKNKKWFFEGDINLALGTYSQLGITPLIGYKITSYVHTGVTLSYIHSWDDTYENTVESDIFGGSLFIRWVPVKEFFLFAEPALYSYKVYSNITTYENKGVPFIFIGAGFNYYINPNVFLTFQAKVDVLHDDDSPYEDEWHPYFSAGIGFGL